MYIFITIVLGLLIAGFGLGVAWGLKLPSNEDR